MPVSEERCICGRFAAVTEAAALAAGGWMGRSDGLAGSMASREAVGRRARSSRAAANRPNS